jgi:hypothetical protein
VPRLRGRGEQGKIVMHNLFLSMLFVATASSARTERKVGVMPASSVILGRHGLAIQRSATPFGLASEARSTSAFKLSSLQYACWFEYRK